ncbi:MAG: hypothetical protein RLZZ519_2197 [Bacteroidota bacterium]
MLILVGCKKTDLSDSGFGSPLLQASGTYSSQIRVNNGMLVFPTQQYLDEFPLVIEKLQVEMDLFIVKKFGANPPEFPNTVAIYDSAGPFQRRNPFTGGALPEIPAAFSEFFERDALMYLFEDGLAYNSLRKYLMIKEQELIASGSYNGGILDPDNYFIPDNYERFILSDRLEITVGSTVYKYVSSEVLIEIKNPSFELLGQLRAAFPAPLDYMSIPTTPHYQTVKTASVVTMNSGLIVVHDLGDPLEPQACNANFSFQQMSNAPLSFSFNCNASNGFMSYRWDFGDGMSSGLLQGSTVAGQLHTYPSAGLYVATLTLFADANGISICSSDQNTVDVNNSCRANFDAHVAQNGAGLVTFTDQSISDPQDNIASWAWDFGDGQNSTFSNPTNLYVDPGDYLVQLAITTTLGCTNTYSDWVNVNNICCKTNRTAWFRATNGQPYSMGSNRYMEGKLWIRSVIFYQKVGAKVTCYKKNVNGNFVQETADELRYSVSGSVWTDQCENRDDMTFSKTKLNQKTWDEAHSTNPPRAIRTRKNRIECSFFVRDNSVSHTGQVLMGDDWNCQAQ